MTNYLKRLAFKKLSLEGYLRLLQRSYFVMYKLGLLRLSDSYKYHYFVKRLIRKGDVVVDIGANLGYYSILFAKWVGEKGHVYAVEPIAIYNSIYNEKAKKFKNITLYPYALGLEEKSIELVSSPHTGYLRTGLPHVYDPDRDGNIEDAEFRFVAEMKKPSKLFESLDKINYLKCDIEGLELVVLSEMKEIIEKHKPKVQVEIWEDNEDKLIGMFKNMGYTSFKLLGKKLMPVDTNPKIGGDYILIHKDDEYMKKLK